MATEPREEIKQVKNRIKRAEKYTETWHANIERWRKLYNNQHYINVAKPREIQYADPTYTNTVDLAIGIMMGNELRWHAFGLKPSKEEQKQTGNIEKLIAGTLLINSIREERHLLYDLYLNFSRDAGGVIYSVFDPRLTEGAEVTVLPDENTGEEMPRFKLYEIPIRTKMVDPLQVILLPGGPRRWLMMGTKERRSVLDVETAYDFKMKGRGYLDQESKASSYDDFYNVWDYVFDDTAGKHLVRNTIIFGGQTVKGPDIMDNYDELPFSIQFFKPTGDKPEDWHNIMTPLEASVSLLERSFNRRAYQVDVFTGLPLIVKTQPGRKVKIDPGLYNSISISTDEDIVFPTWPGTAPDVQLQIEFLRSRVQQSGFSDVMFGSGSNQIAGYAVSQLGDQNRIRLQQPIQHLELLLTVWAKKTLKLLDTFAPETVICVYGQQKGSNYKDEIVIKDLKGYEIKAEIRPVFPNEQARKTAMATQVKGTLSDYTIMERYLDVQQPEDEEKRKMIQMVRRSPAAMQYAIMAELKEMADDGDEVAAMTLQSMMNQGMMGEPGRPKEPSNAEQPMGMPSADGLPVPQEAGGAPPGTSELERQKALANEAPGLMME